MDFSASINPFPSILLRWSEVSVANMSLTQGKMILKYFDLKGAMNELSELTNNEA